MPDPPSDAENLAALVALTNQLFHLIVKQLITLAAVEDYLREQPAFDAARYAALFHAERVKVEARLAGLDPTSPAALLAILRDFEGPIQ